MSSSRVLISLKRPWLQWDSPPHHILQDTAFCSGLKAVRCGSSLPVFKHSTVSSKSGGLLTNTSQCICRNALQGWGFSRCDDVVGRSGHQDLSKLNVMGYMAGAWPQGPISAKTAVFVLLPTPLKPKGAEGRP